MEFNINNTNFYEVAAQKYWSFPSSYKGNPKEDTRNMILSGNYIGSRKYDGAFYKFIKDEAGNMGLFGRSKSVSGEYLNKIEWVPHLHEFFNSLPNGTCLIGELVFPDNEGSNKVTTIMGCLVDKAISRQNSGTPLTYYVFDVLAYNNINLIPANIEERIPYISLLPDCGSVIKAKYLTGQELWFELQNILADGGEGMVITKLGTCYQPGKRPSRQTLKVKKELKDNIDVFFTGHATPATPDYRGKELESWPYWKNTRTGEKIYADTEFAQVELFKDYCIGKSIIPITKGHFHNWAGSLEIGVYDADKDTIIPIGRLSGLPDEIKANPKKFELQPFEVTAMQFTEDGMLRHGKFVQWRPDLNWKDCTLDKIQNRV